MDFHLSKEHLLVRKMYREFAETEVKPLAEELDEEERFPMDRLDRQPSPCLRRFQSAFYVVPG